KNTVLIIGATDRHQFSFAEVPYIRYGLNVMPSFLQSLPIIRGYMNVYQTQSMEDFQNLVDIEDTVFQRMISIIWGLRDETKEGGEGREDMIYALLLELTILLKRLLHAESQDQSGTYKIMNEIKNYIDLHYQEDLSLAELSGRFYLQPNTISKNFRKVWGKSLNQYIHSVRITNAVRILDSREVSITELAEMVGYENVNTFLRQFREKMDVSPLQYRKRMEQEMEGADNRQLFQ
ncbi:MAG: AraC family transcriptional regulator, partial [Candidatus Limivivens sp.]|nr:AraC family transcriptional regulator [Candidatus Limivivens sp.]